MLRRQLADVAEARPFVKSPREAHLLSSGGASLVTFEIATPNASRARISPKASGRKNRSAVELLK